MSALSATLTVLSLFTIIIQFASLLAFGRGEKYPLLRGLVCLGIAGNLLLAVMSPLTAWDALHHWGETGHLIASALFDSDARAIPLFNHRHPPIIPAIYALFSTSPIPIGDLPHAALFWVVCALAVAHASCNILELQHSHRVYVFYLILSIPYLGNHIALWGYSELPILAHMVIATGLVASFTKHRSRLTAFAIVALLTCAAFYKNIAFIMAASIPLAYLWYRFDQTCRVSAWEDRRLARAAYFALHPAVIIAVAVGLAVWLGHHFSGYALQVAGKSLLIVMPTTSQIGDAVRAMFIEKISYPLLITLPLIAIAMRMFEVDRVIANAESLLLCLAIILTLIYLTGWMTEYGFSRSIPSRDTGGTRHFIFPAFFWYLFCMSVFSSYFKRDGISD